MDGFGNLKIDVVTVNERPPRESCGFFVATSVIEPLQTGLTRRSTNLPCHVFYPLEPVPRGYAKQLNISA